MPGVNLEIISIKYFLIRLRIKHFSLYRKKKRNNTRENRARTKSSDQPIVNGILGLNIVLSIRIHVINKKNSPSIVNHIYKHNK